MSSATLSDGLVYFNASIDLTSETCTSVIVSPFGSLTNANISNVITSGVINLTLTDD